MNDKERAIRDALENLRYPSWTLFDPAQASTGQFPKVIATLTNSGVPTAMMVFRDADMATRFTECSGMSELKPLALNDPQEVLDAMDYCERLGATHVALNVDCQRGPDGLYGRTAGGLFVTIEGFKFGLRKNPADPGFSDN